MVQPLEEIAPGEETLVETAHNLGIASTTYHRRAAAIQLLSASRIGFYGELDLLLLRRGTWS